MQIRPCYARSRRNAIARESNHEKNHARACRARIDVTAWPSAEGRPTRFWNLTRHTISEFHLAPAGTANCGPNQCKNDKDGTVDPDERLRITGMPPGSYDARLVDVSRRTCVVRNIKVKAGEIFSIEEKELTSCTQVIPLGAVPTACAHCGIGDPPSHATIAC